MAHGAGLGVVKDDQCLSFFQFLKNRIELSGLKDLNRPTLAYNPNSFCACLT
jgi:hypothetical protein